MSAQPASAAHADAGMAARTIEHNRRLLVILMALMAVSGAVLVRHVVAWPATAWMFMYNPADFHTFADLIDFLRRLRAPIPPVLAAVEILSVQLTGSTALVTTHLYRLTIVGSYVLAIALARASRWRSAAAFGLGLLFLSITTSVQAQNPQLYDTFFPFCLLLTLVLLQWMGSARSAPARLAGCAFTGFFLSMAELSRPFALLLVPLVVIAAYAALRQHRRRYFAAVVAPLILFSGTWHLHLYAAYGELVASNHSGFNLIRAWPDADGPDLVPEPERDMHPADRWPNLNTAAHAENSRRLERAVAAYIVQHPAAAGVNVGRRIGALLSAPVLDYPERSGPRLLAVVPPRPLLILYKAAVPLSATLLLVNLGLLIAAGIRAGRRCPMLLANVGNVLLLATGYILLALSLGEAHEEARLLLSLLPLLAATPAAQPLTGVVAGRA